MADANARYFYHCDGLGSVVALCDVNNVLVERYAYDVFGRPTIRDANGTEIAASVFANPYLFTGRAWDPETALYYYRARYYDYFTGRFLQPDPIGYADGMSLYAYCRNNPLIWLDPYGLCAGGKGGLGSRIQEFLRQANRELLGSLKAYAHNARMAMMAHGPQAIGGHIVVAYVNPFTGDGTDYTSNLIGFNIMFFFEDLSLRIYTFHALDPSNLVGGLDVGVKGELVAGWGSNPDTWEGDFDALSGGAAISGSGFQSPDPGSDWHGLTFGGGVSLPGVAYEETTYQEQFSIGAGGNEY